jgi:hypothetical protein
LPFFSEEGILSTQLVVVTCASLPSSGPLLLAEQEVVDGTLLPLVRAAANFSVFIIFVTEVASDDDVTICCSLEKNLRSTNYIMLILKNLI